MKTSERAIRERWFFDFSIKAIQAGIYDAGKIDWDTATYLFLSGITVDDAISKLSPQLKIQEGL